MFNTKLGEFQHFLMAVYCFQTVPVPGLCPVCLLALVPRQEMEHPAPALGLCPIQRGPALPRNSPVYHSPLYSANICFVLRCLYHGI